MAVALAFGVVALLVFTGFLAAVFARLFGGMVWGLLAVFVLYGIVAGGAALLGMKSLRSVRPGDFPVTWEEVRKDWDALELARSAPKEPEERDDDELPRDERFGPDAVRPVADLQRRGLRSPIPGGVGMSEHVERIEALRRRGAHERETLAATVVAIRAGDRRTP